MQPTWLRVILLAVLIHKVWCDTLNNRADDNVKSKDLCFVRRTHSDGKMFAMSCASFCLILLSQPRCVGKLCLCDPVFFPTPESNFDRKLLSDVKWKPVSLQDDDEVKEAESSSKYDKIGEILLAKPNEIERLKPLTVKEPIRFEHVIV